MPSRSMSGRRGSGRKAPGRTSLYFSLPASARLRSSWLIPAVPASAMPPAGRVLPLKCSHSSPFARTSICQIRSRNFAGAKASMPSGCSRTWPSASTTAWASLAGICRPPPEGQGDRVASLLLEERCRRQGAAGQKEVVRLCCLLHLDPRIVEARAGTDVAEVIGRERGGGGAVEGRAAPQALWQPHD